MPGANPGDHSYPRPLARDLLEGWARNMEPAEAGGGTEQLIASGTQRLFRGSSILPSIFFLPVLQREASPLPPLSQLHPCLTFVNDKNKGNGHSGSGGV